MKRKIIIRVLDHAGFSRPHVQQALSDVEKILSSHKIPFEIIEDMGNEYTVSEDGEGYTKMKVRHALQKQLDALTERATHPEFNDDLAGITNAAVAVADELNKPDDFAF